MTLRVADILSHVPDAGSVRAWNDPVTDPPTHEPYSTALAAARRATGREESIWTGTGTVQGRRVALVVGDPEFLGGSLGVGASKRLTRAIERATEQGLPILSFPVGGGTRMQEGTIAFLQMVTITGAVMAHKAANLPYLVYLRSPTMGGVFASWGSLGHVTLAEPGALVGFLGPRVYEALYGEPFPPGVQLAENLAARGVIDAVVPLDDLAGVFDRLLTVCLARRERGLTSENHPPTPPEEMSVPIEPTDAWESVLLTRLPDRPGLRELLQVAEDVTMLNGTGAGESHPGSVLALARFGQAPCVVLGQDRHAQALTGPLDAGALREARRGLRLSRELRLPLVTVIDTQGAALSTQAEEGGLASEIARTLSELLTLPTPTVSVLLGQGAGGIALALVPADRVLATRHAWLAPLPPEGASAIVHRDTDHAPDLARLQGIAAPDLLATGIIDRIIPEPADTVAEPEVFTATVAAAIADELLRVMAVPRPQRRAARAARYRWLGQQVSS